MRLLLDSHTLIWAVDDPDRLSPGSRAILQDPSNDRLVSPATFWEIGIKVGLGKLPLSIAYRPWMEQAIQDLSLTLLPITLDHAEKQSKLPWHHRDPFDRMLVAQALVEGVPLVSADPAVDAYGIHRLW
ncbi:MAG: type II toxin-antitoxin system VapC family toxin [Isosphaeraceae bacterium]